MAITVGNLNSMVSYKGRVDRAIPARGTGRQPNRAANSHTECCLGRLAYFCKQCGAPAATPEDLRAHYLKHHPKAMTETGGTYLPGDPNAPLGVRMPCRKCGRLISAKHHGLHKCGTRWSVPGKRRKNHAA